MKKLCVRAIVSFDCVCVYVCLYVCVCVCGGGRTTVCVPKVSDMEQLSELRHRPNELLAAEFTQRTLDLVARRVAQAVRQCVASRERGKELTFMNE